MTRLADPVRRSAARTATLVAIPVALLVGLGLLWSFGAFARPDTGPVTMSAPTLTPEVATVCRAVVADLPSTVLERAQRPVTAGAEQNAAYGDPPVTLACASEPATVNPTDYVYPLSGVCWHAASVSDGSVWTTIDRQVPVQVTVPGPTDGASQTVIGFSEAVRRNDPAVSAVPTGCT